MQEIYNTVPFAIRQGKNSVEILEPLSAEILDMDVISDEFKPSAPTITDHIWGFFTGKQIIKKKSSQLYLIFQANIDII